MDLQTQSIDIVNYKDIVSLEVVQHEKAQLVFETAPTEDGPITAQLLVPGCEDGHAHHCSRLSHTVLHTDRQSYLSIYVHPGDTDIWLILVGWLLGFVALLLLLFWIFRIWVKRRETTEQTSGSKYLQGRQSLNYQNSRSCKEVLEARGDKLQNGWQERHDNDEDTDIEDKQMKKLKHKNCLDPDRTCDLDEHQESQIKVKNGHIPNGVHKPSTSHHRGSSSPNTSSFTSVHNRPVMSSPRASPQWLVKSAVPWWYYLLTAGVVLAFGTLVWSGQHRAGGHSSQHPMVLKVSIPSSTHIRHIRSYSEDPQIRDVSLHPPASSALVTKLQLLDLSMGCRSNLTDCRTHAMCEASSQQRGVKCRCNRGFYLKDLECMPCRTTCQEGFYMTKQCSANEDVVCKPCKQCGGTSYQVAACTSTQDTLCIDVTFPIKQFQSRVTSIEELINLNVSMSKNVFLERLHHVKRLETPLYLSNNRQEIQFVWRRESGLEIKVKVSDIYLIPEYIDIDHVDDRAFIVEHESYPQDIKNNLWSVMKHNCRHPLPDRYDLTLEVSKKQTTRATEMTCDSRDPKRPPCPEGYADGDKYIYENLEYPCDKVILANQVLLFQVVILAHQTNSDSSGLFKATKNNVLCSGNTDIINTIFRKSTRKTKFLTFPSAQCQSFESQCYNCLTQKACQYGSNVTDCCNLGCHSEAACKNYYSNTCPVAPVECIKGDISKFSILPRYPSIPDRFVCHLRYMPPRHLFLLSYETSVPGMKFVFQSRFEEIKYKNYTDHHQGFNKVDFLEMSHYSENKYSNEVFLAGIFDKTSAASPKPVRQYKLHKARESWAFDRSFQRYRVTQDSSNQYRAQISFEEPFLFSTQTWFQGGCQKNVSQIVPSQPNYELFGLPVVEPDKTRKDGRFVYQLMSEKSTPHIRFAIPENISILSFYRDELGSARLYPGSLSGRIAWNKAKRLWNITIKGSISVCPGLFTLELFSENTATRIALYDMLVNCPENFSIRFHLQRNSVEFSDVFIAVINDTVSSYRIVLSSIQGPSFFHSQKEDVAATKTHETSPWAAIIVIIILCVISSSILLCVYAYCDKQKVKHIPMDNITVPKPDLGPEITLLQNIDQPKKKEGMTAQAKFVMTALAILYVIYAFLFTLTALFCLLHVIQGSNMHSITLVSDSSEKIQMHIKETLQKMVDYENNETQRLLTRTQDRLDACNTHLKQTLSASIPDINLELMKKLSIIFPSKGTVEEMLQMYHTKRQTAYEERMDKFVKEFNETLETNLHKLHTTYTAYLRDVAQNRWFKFPRDLFMDQLRQERPWAATLDIPENLADFLTWLEIDKVQEVIEIREILMNKMLTVLPKVDFSGLLNATGSNKVRDILSNITDTEFNFKFASSLPPGYHGFKMYQLNSNPYDTLYTNIDKNIKTLSSSKMISSIRGIVYPLFISVFVFLDILLLMYRFSWLRKCLNVFKNGLEQTVPFDSITRKIHFILTGKDVKRPEDSLDHPYDYYMSNKEDIWGENTELYFLYCQASPKSKEEILRDLWAHKQRQKPKPENKPPEKPDSCGMPMLKFAYRLFISAVFVRLVIICGFVLLVCFFAKAINDLVTMESAVFLMDTDSLMPILARQSLITDNVITAYGGYLNDFLASFKRVLDSEVQTLNTMLVHVAERQSMLLNTLISDMCNLAEMEECGEALNLVTASLASCNFLPLHTRPYTGFHENILTEFIRAELSPLVLNLRSILFSTLYLLLTYAAAMLICQILARVLFVHLQKSRHMKTIKLFQLPGTDPYEQQSFREKEMYDGHSVIAESCESGVYDLTS